MEDVPNPDDLLFLEHLVECFPAHCSPNKAGQLAMEVVIPLQLVVRAGLCKKLLGPQEGMGSCSNYRGKLWTQPSSIS